MYKVKFLDTIAFIYTNEILYAITYNVSLSVSRPLSPPFPPSLPLFSFPLSLFFPSINDISSILRTFNDPKCHRELLDITFHEATCTCTCIITIHVRGAQDATKLTEFWCVPFSKCCKYFHSLQLTISLAK